MSNPTPKADALRAMREAKFGARPATGRPKVADLKAAIVASHAGEKKAVRLAKKTKSAKNAAQD